MTNDFKEKQEKLYINPETGSIDTYDGWDYINDNGEKVNAVDLGEVIEYLINEEYI